MVLSVAAPMILVVDDNAPLRYAVARTLARSGFEITEASTGQEALDLISRRPPDLVVLDVNLPDIHGFDVARRLKQDRETAAIPILHLSASSVQMEDRLEGLAAGADAYLIEPVEPGELVANIRALLRMRDAEAGLQRTTAMLAAVVEASPLAIIVCDREQIVRTWNPAAERLFGWTDAEVVGHPLAARGLFPDAVMARLERGGSMASFETRSRRKDGTERDIAVFGSPLYRSVAPGYAIMVEDISSRKIYERERTELLAREREARREAEAANRLKDEFLATLSHELRTPLNAIMGWLSMLRKPVLDEAGRERAMAIIERNLNSQQQLVSDILEVSQIIRGQMRLDLKPVDVIDAVSAAIDSVAPTAVAKHQTVTRAFPPGPCLVAGDAERLQQVFWNLLSNAVKYTPREGRIEVAVTQRDGEVEVVVRDWGNGIEPDVLPHIFDRFRQGDSGPTRKYGGLGLGLSIVRHLTEMHGGSVRAESGGLGQGSAFVVTLPPA